MEQSNIKNYRTDEQEYFSSIEKYFKDSSSTYTEKMHAFARFAPRQALAYFLARNSVFDKIINIHGSILDFGIYRGSSFFTWQQLSAIYEPYNHTRKIVGFDSFEGFSSLSDTDISGEGKNFPLKTEGGMAFPNGQSEIEQGISLCDLNRPLGHVNKAKAIKGKLPSALNQYLSDHPESIIALANFGLGLYEPTRDILTALKPRLQRGSILVFEDLNQAMWPGESRALYEVFIPSEISLERSAICPHLSWMTYKP
jgi:hypothetical protein